MLNGASSYVDLNESVVIIRWNPAAICAAFATVLNGFLLAVLVPVAAARASQLLGTLAAAALFGAVGFSVVSSRGFDLSLPLLSMVVFDHTQAPGSEPAPPGISIAPGGTATAAPQLHRGSISCVC